jgi:Uma2 family endonuclease
MSLATERLAGWPELLHMWQTLDLPHGWRAEITEGGIAVTPPPDHDHNAIAHLVHRALLKRIPEKWAVYQTHGLRMAGAHKVFIPDLVVAPEDAPVEADDRLLLSKHALLVVEITSASNPIPDRTTKKDAYAQGGVGIYVLIDRWAEPKARVTVFSKPADGAYQRSVTTPFGETIEVPEPIDLQLDTRSFC